MRLTERLDQVGNDVKKLKESIIRPGQYDESDLKGWLQVKRSGREWDTRVVEAATIIVEVIKGTRPDYHLREAMTTSDFPLLYADVMYRQMLGNYQAITPSYPAYFRIYDLRDFRKLHLQILEGGQSRLDKVAERAPYPETTFLESEKSIQVFKYGRRYGITWEMLINDDLNAWADKPAMMAVGARRSEEYLAAQQLVDANGPHASYYTAGNGNIVTANPALSLAALQTAMGQIGYQTDSEGEPILIEMMTLVVGNRALEITANNILNALTLELSESGGTTNQKLWAQNWIKSGGKITIAYNPYIPLIATTKKNSWFLVANPNDMTTRPAFMFGFLRGRRTPQITVKDPDATLLGGGAVDPTEGSFDNDSIDYRIRHVFGAAQGDPKMSVASGVA